MLLYEFEGKELFKVYRVNVPQSLLLDSNNQKVTLSLPLILKAQILSGNRLKSGGIIKVDSELLLKDELKKLFGKEINGAKVEKVLAEELVQIEREYYLSFSYDTSTRGPILTFTESGGTGIEERGAKSYPVDILEGYQGEDVPQELVETAKKLWQIFTKYDCELVEVNPLVVDSQGKVWALDAKVILDDDADFRREIKFPERNLFGRAPTKAEIEARKIDEGDHRGTAGSVYWELDGDIAVIAAGGGGSIVNMDALLAFGGKPANYTEHSGNPPREKLKRLTKIILSKPGLKGCWFVGGTANFTDIYETLIGFVEGLREISPKPTYPIVIRRGGPRDKQAFEVLKEIGEKEGFNFHIFGRETPMTSTAKIMVELAYKKEKKD